MLEIQKYLQTGRPADLKEELDINFKVYDDRIIFKYTMKSPKYHPIVKECRGIILSTVPGHTYEVLSRGMDRFYNYGEGNDCETFDWDNCIVFNKLDGSLIKVYHDGNKWCTSTNGTAFAEGESPLGKTYHDLFVEAIGMDLQKMCEDWNKSLTFIFELTSPENRIVTRYTETKATLLAVRSNLDGNYIEYDRLDKFIKYNNPIFSVAKSYNINNERDVKKYVESRNPTDEGVVLYDKGTQQRIKLKNTAYVAIHHLRGNEVTLKSICTLLIKGEMDEYLTYFPEDYETMKPYINKYNKLKDDVWNVYNLFKHIEDQKEFALKVKDLPYCGFLFRLRKGVAMDDMFNVNQVSQFVNLFERL